MTELEKLKQQLNQLQEKINNLEKQDKKRKWQPAFEDVYFYVSSEGDIYTEKWCMTLDDTFRISSGNCFKTLEEAEKHLENIKTKAELRQLADELNGEEVIDWKNENQQKFNLCYNYGTMDTDIAGLWQERRYSNRSQGTIYCLDENFLKFAIQRIGEQRLINMIKAGV